MAVTTHPRLLLRVLKGKVKALMEQTDTVDLVLLHLSTVTLPHRHLSGTTRRCHHRHIHITILRTLQRVLSKMVIITHTIIMDSIRTVLQVDRRRTLLLRHNSMSSKTEPLMNHSNRLLMTAVAMPNLEVGQLQHLDHLLRVVAVDDLIQIPSNV